MSIRRRTRNRPLTLALAGAMLATAPLLGGCGIVNQFLPGGGGGGGIGGVIPGQSVPADFPSEVPLIDGEVVLGLAVPGDDGEKAWNVTIKVSGADAFDRISQQLEGAGFEHQEFNITDDSSSGAFTKDPYAVIVVVTQTDGDWTANYTVTNAAT